MDSQTISIEECQAAYRDAKAEASRDFDELRPCEQDVFELIGYETDWRRIRDALMSSRRDREVLKEFMKNRVKNDMQRARESVSYLTDRQYENIKANYERKSIS